MVEATLTATAGGTAETVETPTARAIRRFKRRKGALLALIVIAIFVGAAVLAPLLSPYEPDLQTWSAVRKAPSALHWFGTDDLGRDVLARVIYGARASLLAGVISIAIALLVGVPIGLIAGYLGGFIDALFSRITDALLACPFLILAIALAAFLGPSLGNAMIAIGITTTPIFIRLTRGQVMAVKVEDYVEAARAVGNPHWRIALVQSCRTSCRHCWCSRRFQSPPPSLPKPHCRFSASASNRRRRHGAACSTPRNGFWSMRRGWRSGRGWPSS
jgi:peptide/nickel transport system permease protein